MHFIADGSCILLGLSFSVCPAIVECHIVASSWQKYEFMKTFSFSYVIVNDFDWLNDDRYSVITCNLEFTSLELSENIYQKNCLLNHTFCGRLSEKRAKMVVVLNPFQVSFLIDILFIARETYVFCILWRDRKLIFLPRQNLHSEILIS